MDNSTVNERPVGAKVLRSIFIGIGLLFLNLIFVLGPYIALWGIFIGFGTAGISMMLSSIGLMAANFIMLPFEMTVPLILIEHPFLIYLVAAMLFGFGGILTGLILWPAKYLCIGTGKYLQWQMKIIRGDQYV